MNADDRGPASEAKPPIAPGPGGAPVRREGLVPPTGSVPQRTAFRPVTGTHQTTPGVANQGAAPAAARPASYAPSTNTPGVASRVPASEQMRTAPAANPFAPTSGQVRSAAPTTPSASTGTVAPAARASAAASAAAAAGSAGIGRLKEVASNKLRMQDTEPNLPGAPRKVRVLLSRVDPWSALKIGFLLSIAVGIMTMVATHVLWMTLNEMGTFETINEWVAKLFTQGQEVNILQFFAYKKDMSAMLLVSVVNVVLISGLSVITAFIYNMIARVVGGVYVTLTDD